MKGLSTLTKNTKKNQKTGLVTLDHFRKTNPRDSSRLIEQSQVQYYACAYHVGERITNFCMNPTCLLPLCPKCIKVHSEEHEQMGVYATFPTIQQCLHQSKDIQTNSIARLEELSQVCQEMALLHHRHILESKQQLQKAKQQLIEYIHGIFSFYQLQTEKIIQESSNNYQNQLILFHKEIMNLMTNQKQLLKKYSNQNTRMQFLIDFHSKPDITSLLNQHATTIDSFKPNYLQLSINTYELQRIKVIIKKYLDFGPFSQEVQNNLQKNPHYKKITINPYYARKFDEDLMDQSKTEMRRREDEKQFVRSPIKNMWKSQNQILKDMYTTSENKYSFENDFLKSSNLKRQEGGLIGGAIREKLQRNSRLENFQSPLQAYSLQKSRKQRY